MLGIRNINRWHKSHCLARALRIFSEREREDIVNSPLLLPTAGIRFQDKNNPLTLLNNVPACLNVTGQSQCWREFVGCLSLSCFDLSHCTVEIEKHMITDSVTSSEEPPHRWVPPPSTTSSSWSRWLRIKQGKWSCSKGWRCCTSDPIIEIFECVLNVECFHWLTLNYTRNRL